MAVDNVDSQSAYQKLVKDSTKTNSKRNTGELGKNEFLNLLVTQLRYQDPLNPTDDKQFIAQMAQFTSLEQMQNMNTNMTSVKAFGMIGKYVAASVKNETTGKTEAVEGLVSSVKVKDGKNYVVVNGKDIEVDKVTDIKDTAAVNNANLSAYTNLIGYQAKGYLYDSQKGYFVGVNGNVSSVEKGQYEDYAVMDGVKVSISGIVTDTPSTDPNYIENTLKACLPKEDDKSTTNVDESSPGKEITVTAIDRSTGQEVQVKAVLKSYSKNSTGQYTVELDQVHVPVDSISSIKPK